MLGFVKLISFMLVCYRFYCYIELLVCCMRKF